jgi:uncharacterized protein (DUF1800 family)
LTAFNRFGLGARAEDALAAGDPREALEAELSAPGAGLLRQPDLPSGVQAFRIYYDYSSLQAERRANEEAMRGAAIAMPAPNESTPPPPAAAAPMGMMATPPVKKPRTPIDEAFLAEAAARAAAACAAPVGFVERLVAFWSNHFCISATKGMAERASAGAFEREAIRPFVLGRFADMLKAVERHPTMLVFLDNAQSVGPNSQVGRRAKRGLNENLAREIMELHTLGVDGGYTQADVTEFARILTGWTFAGRDGALGPPGAFVFNARAHEEGARALRGRTYAQDGVDQGDAALDDLARSPATARHIAAKFARAFVADAPPPALVARLTHTFQSSDGDLGALARALIADADAWSAPPTKLRDPWQMMIAAHRALRLDPAKPERLVEALNLLGMPLWSPGGPNGFPDTADAWASPEGIKTRVEIAAGLGRLVKDGPPPGELLARILPDASEWTRQTVLRAESQPQAYALLILSPEFQRR